jgi:integrase
MAILCHRVRREGAAVGRRGHDEGSIYQRESDGKWVAAVNLGYGPNGKRKRKVFYGLTRREVAEKLKTALHDQQQGTLPQDTERQTVGQFMERWLQDSAKPTVRASTFESYQILTRTHIIPGLGRIQLRKLTPQQVQAFLNHKLESGLSARTVQYLHSILHRALGLAVKWDLVSRNVASLVSPPRVKQNEIQPFTPQQARQFLDAVKGNRLEALYSVALALGLRRGEALGLRWEDVDLDAGTLTVRVNLQRIAGKLQLVEPKTERSRRTIKLPQMAVAALRNHKVLQLEERLLAGSRWQDSGALFTSTIGTFIDPRNLNRQFEKMLEQAGLPKRRFHDLRHTCATLLLVQGVHPRVVMEILGHSRISETMDRYSHVVPGLQEDAADRLNKLLSG